MKREDIPNAIRLHGRRIEALEDACRIYEGRLDAYASKVDELCTVIDAVSGALALIQQNYFIRNYNCAHGVTVKGPGVLGFDASLLCKDCQAEAVKNARCPYAEGCAPQGCPLSDCLVPVRA